MNTLLRSVLLVASVVVLVSCGGEGPARLPDAPAPPALDGECDKGWFDSAFRLEVSGRLGLRERDPGRLARTEIQDAELVERARMCLERVLDEAASPTRARSGLAFGLLAQGRFSPLDWLDILTGYRDRKLAPCLGRNRGVPKAQARERCGQELDGMRPDLVVVHTCRVLERAVKQSPPEYGREAVQRIVHSGLSGHALGACLGIVVERMWQSDAALLRILDELTGKPNGAFLYTHFMRMGADLLPRLTQMAQVEDRAARGRASDGTSGCKATQLFWRLVDQDKIILEGELEDIRIPEGATCVQQMGVLLPRAHRP